MESIIGLIVLYGAWYIVTSVLGAGARAVKKAITGKETYFGPAQIRITDDHHTETGIDFRSLEFRGNPGLAKSENLTLLAFIRDVTEGDWTPVISLLNETQESDSTCYLQKTNLGIVQPGMSFTEWFRIGFICPALLQTSRKGLRKLKIHALLIQNEIKDYAIQQSELKCERNDVLWASTIESEIYFPGDGYFDASENRAESQALSVKIAIAIAMADSSFDENEGKIIKSWIEKTISPFSEDRREELKNIYNNSFIEAYEEAINGNLKLSPLVDRLNEIGDKKCKYDCIELCLDVMAADGIADKNEMELIRNIADSLDINMEEFENLREQASVSINVSASSTDDLGALIGLQEGWTKEEKMSFLRDEYKKWSNRLNSLPEGNERNAAQSMLDNIATLRNQLK
jgi:tellurite resistance protein